jgi:hypothetical protein
MADESFLGGLLGAPDNTTVDPNTGMTAAQRQQSIFGTFGNLGALLMAAGQKQMPAERAKYLAQIGQIPGQMQQQLTDAQKLYMQKQMNEQQRKLLSLQAQKAETELGREKRISADIESNIENIPEALRPFARANPTAFAQAQASAKLSQMYRNPTAFDQKYQATLAATGDPKIASGVAAGLLQISKDAAGQPILINVGEGTSRPLAGGQGSAALYGLPQLGPNGAPAAPVGGPVAPAGAPQQPSAPAGGPQASAAPAAPQNPYPSATINPNLDYTKIFGVPGVTNFVAGKMQDVTRGEMTGTRSQAFQAMSDYAQMRNDLIGSIGADSSNPRLKMVQERVSALLPKDVSLFTGPSESLKDFSSARNMIDSEIKTFSNIINSPGYGKDVKEKAAKSVQELMRGRDNLSIMIDSIGEGIKSKGAPSAGATVGANIANMSKGQKEIPAGVQTYINPKTGQRGAVINGKWELF